MLSDAIWYLNEADGKYRTRFKSLEVMTLVWNEPASQIRIVHEHVITRVDLNSRMLANSAELLDNPQQLHSLLDEAVPCIVTKTEPNRLNSGAGVGWGRYATTKIAVYDTAVHPPVLFELPVVDLLE